MEGIVIFQQAWIKIKLAKKPFYQLVHMLKAEKPD